MTNRRCYQCGDEDLGEVQARRKAEVRAWADAQIAAADRALIGVPTEESTVFDQSDTEDLTDPEIEPEKPEVEVEPEKPVKRTPHPKKAAADKD